MFSFEYPILSILLLLPFAAKAISSPREEKEIAHIFYPNIKNLQNSYGKFSQRKGIINISNILFYLVWILLVAAIMRPQLVDSKTNITNKGRDIIIAADLSGSMHALDFSTKDKYIDRLDIAKETTKKFIEKRHGDRIGMVLFGDYAYLHVPLTHDLDSVSAMLNNTAIGMAGESTAIGDAIGLSVKKLRDKNAKSSSIILLTDGENSSGSLDPIDAAKISNNYGIKIYVIGIGSSGIAPMADRSGRIFNVEVKIDEKTLKKIANISGGAYYNVRDKNTMDQVFERINELEKTESEIREYLIKKELYRIPLSAALILTFFMFLYNIWRANR